MFDIFDVIDGKAELPEEKEKKQPVEKKEEIQKEQEESKEVENIKPVEDEKEELIIQDDKPYENLAPYNEIPLSFFENSITNHVLVGRKKSVFKKYGEDASLYVGKVYEPNFQPKEIYYDSLNPHVVFVCGSRGSGKSYFLGVLAEELAMKNKNVGMVVIDPVGVFWSMKYPNREEREVALLKEYGLEPKGLDNIFVFIPEGAKNATPEETYDTTFTMQPSFLTAEDWSITFGFDRFSPLGLLLEKVLKKVEKGYRTLDGIIFKPKHKNYDLNDIIYCLENDSELNSKERGFKKDSIRALVSRFEASKEWGIFAKTGTPLIEISVPGQLTIIDVSFLDENVSALLVGILSRRILAARKINTRKQAALKVGSELKSNLEYDIPPTWLFIDEAHTLIPGGGIITPASKALIEYVKQGRQPGCSLVFATQQPSAIDPRVLSQVGTLLTYKLVFDDDIKAVFKRMPTVVPKAFKKPDYIKKLEIGIPLFADRVETTSRVFRAKIRPRMSQHEGRETQTAEIGRNLTKEDILKIMVEITRTKLSSYDELDVKAMKTLLKILNMKYKTDILFDEFSNAIIESGVSYDKEKYFLEKDDDVEKYQEKITYKLITPKFEEDEIEGIIKRKTGWIDFSLKKVYRPILKVNYRIFNKNGSFVSNIAYVDPVKVEFLHFVDKEFVYSEGLGFLRMFDADDANVLLQLHRLKEFDMETMKNKFGFGDVKLKRMMDRFIQVGLIRKEKHGIKNIYYMMKHIELPKNPLIPLLSSLGELPVIDVEADKDSILEPRISMEGIRNILGLLWKDIKVDDIETILREEYMITNLETKETILFESYNTKRVK